MTDTELANETMAEMINKLSEPPLKFEKSSTIKVSEEFHIGGKGIWLGIERSANPGEDEISEFLKAREILVRSFQAMTQTSPTDFNTGETAAPAVDKRIEAFIQDINACGAIDEKNGLGVQVGLLSFEELSAGDPRLKAAYDLKMMQLKAKK